MTKKDYELVATVLAKRMAREANVGDYGKYELVKQVMYDFCEEFTNMFTNFDHDRWHEFIVHTINANLAPGVNFREFHN